MAKKIDLYDVAILEALQEDASQTQRELSERISMSQNACWRRIKRFENDGTIKRRTIVLNREKVGAQLVVFAMVKTRQHSEVWLKHFHAHVRSIPDVIDFYRIGGEYDYLLKVVTRNMEAYDQVYRRLIEKVDLETVTSFFAMEAILEQRPLRLDPVS